MWVILDDLEESLTGTRPESHVAGPQLLPKLALECDRKARSNLELMHTKRGSLRKLTQNHQYKS